MRVAEIVQVEPVGPGAWRVTIRWEVGVRRGQLVRLVRDDTDSTVYEVGEVGPDTMTLGPWGPDLGPPEVGAALHTHVGGRHTGLGDLIARGTKALGIEPCRQCEERREALNRIVPKLW